MAQPAKKKPNRDETLLGPEQVVTIRVDDDTDEREHTQDKMIAPGRIFARDYLLYVGRRSSASQSRLVSPTASYVGLLH